MAGIDNNTVLYLRGDSFEDLSLNPKTVSNSGATVIDDGVFTKALLLSSSNYINVDADSSIDFGTGDFTLSCYVKPNGTSGTLFAYQWANSTTGYAWGIRIVSSKVRFMINTGSEKYIDSSSNVSTSSFTHIAITRESGVVKLFVNGKLESTVTYSGSLLVNSQKRVSIGKHSNNSVGGFDGSISDIFISNKCLYTKDFTPPNQPFNSISIDVTNKTFSQIDFNVTKLSQETINKVEVLVNNIVSETYTDNYDNLTYNIDNSLCSIGNNKITIRVTYDDNYVEEEILTHTVTVNKLPTSSSLKDVIDRQELLNSSIEVQKNNLKNILVSKNVEVAEEDKLLDLINKVGELPNMEIVEELQNNQHQITNKISILEAENEKLKVEQEQQNEEILVNMLANTEMFEMILGMMPMMLSEDKTKNSGGSSMIEVYCTLIIKNVKTIEDVPLVIREQVIERLKQLEVPVK